VKNAASCSANMTDTQLTSYQYSEIYITVYLFYSLLYIVSFVY